MKMMTRLGFLVGMMLMAAQMYYIFGKQPARRPAQAPAATGVRAPAAHGQKAQPARPAAARPPPNYNPINSAVNAANRANARQQQMNRQLNQNH